ncbi:unnamed protein product [Phaedon cochleariae]|uniref:WD repeat-containing protein 44 n=1 Tax=Phaedon cochleariae TaxID=80249 RepID=A0A9P0DQ03_PHACE|nr:unnamed protein product [Phaedon cochleariae]
MRNMHSDSDSEEFYDAQDDLTSNNSRKGNRPSRDSLTKRATSEPNISGLIEEKNTVESETKHVLPGGRKKFKELRQRLQNDEEDYQASNISPPGSHTSSVDGVFAASSRQSHPFRIIEHDTISLQSLNSLGRIGRILGGVADTGIPAVPADHGRKPTPTTALSSSSLDSTSTGSSRQFSKHPSTATLSPAGPADEPAPRPPLQEPDVIASTKAGAGSKVGAGSPRGEPNAGQMCRDAPVAPPRRKKKSQVPTVLQLSKSSSVTTFQSTDLDSPASTIASLTRDLEHTLDRLPSTKSEGRTAPPSNRPAPYSDHPAYYSDRPAHSADHLSDDYPRRGSAFLSDYSLDIGQLRLLAGQFVVKPQEGESGSGGEGEEGGEGLGVLAQLGEEESPRGSATRGSMGHYSLGPHRGTHQYEHRKTASERRRSAGDENFFRSLSHVRTHTNSGKQLSDLEILEQVTVLNLDTGERVPLSVAEDKIPQCLNPLSLHIMRITSEYVSGSGAEKEKESDEESVDNRKTEVLVGENGLEGGGIKQKTAKLKRFLGSTVKKTMNRAKTIAQEVSHARHKEDIIDIVDNVHPGEQTYKLKASNSHKAPFEFEKIEHVQELKDSQHEGPIWCMKFSGCGRLLATAGQDKILRIWIVRDAFPFFQDMRTKYNAEKVSPTPSQESLASHHSTDQSIHAAYEGLTADEVNKLTFMPKPFCTYAGHTSDLLDVSWSKNYFILSSSMDKTVRLWHISRKECLCCFQHIDFVTAIVFHPRDDRYFLSGSLDGKLRLWNIPDKKVAVWNEVEGNPKLITAANFCQNGKFAVVGTYDGRCIFYITDQLKYHTQIHVRSSRGRNAVGRKISGIEPMPGEDKILVTSNDSRIRLYDLRDLNVSCKYKGYVNTSSQIKASFSHDGKYIISGSENRDIYIWKTNHDYSKFSSARRDRNDYWEAVKAHNAVVTCAIFAPNPEAIIGMLEENARQIEEEKVEDPVVEQHTKGRGGYVLISADFGGCIKVFINKTKPKHSSLPVSALA